MSDTYDLATAVLTEYMERPEDAQANLYELTAEDWVLSEPETDRERAIWIVLGNLLDYTAELEAVIEELEEIKAEEEGDV